MARFAGLASLVRSGGVVLLGALCGTAAADTAEPVTELLWPEGAPGAVGDEEADKPTLIVHLPAQDKTTGTAIVICPGGGYAHLAMGHEGDQIAAWLNEHGVAAFILTYRHGPRYLHPAPLQDVQRALRTVRARAEEWGVNPDRIGVMGFSAGGHLASTAGTHFTKGRRLAKDPIERASSRPDFMILIYPVISLTSPKSHRGSLHNLLGPDPDPALKAELSSELHVTKHTPPAFLVHTTADGAVASENSAMFYLALREKKVSGELHIYEKGKHGFGLAVDDPVLSTWPGHCIAWLRAQGFLPAQ
ncbi:MAG: alpha/beta hydrolase [Candidatus Hydrogenedentes bacterium]|nr:alpha/beta hydrolase [Candidatus Hydrogenedentota bacterium]